MYVCAFVCVSDRPTVCCGCDPGECAVCSPSQAVAQVMIQSFQLSSCALFNAQMQDVSHHGHVFLSILGPYLDVCL